MKKWKMLKMKLPIFLNNRDPNNKGLKTEFKIKRNLNKMW